MGGHIIQTNWSDRQATLSSLQFPNTSHFTRDYEGFGRERKRCQASFLPESRHTTDGLPPHAGAVPRLAPPLLGQRRAIMPNSTPTIGGPTRPMYSSSVGLR